MSTDDEVVRGRKIRAKNDLLLVEWEQDGRIRRSWVSKDMVEEQGEDYADVVNPGAGIPYGIDFARLVELQATPAALDTELKRRGIWTLNDMRANLPAVAAALQNVYGVDLAHLVQVATKHIEQMEV